MKTALELLSNVQVASPCTVSWDNMIGDEFSRFCGQCEKNVYNISAMTAEAASQLLREKEGKLCVRFYQRADGTMLTADCPESGQQVIPRKRPWALVAASLAGLMAVGGCTSESSKPTLKQDSGPSDPPALRCVMGEPAPIKALQPQNVQFEVGPTPREVNPQPTGGSQ
jgi:hypothetical protein